MPLFVLPPPPWALMVNIRYILKSVNRIARFARITEMFSFPKDADLLRVPPNFTLSLS